jgi:hypothetical protein
MFGPPRDSRRALSATPGRESRGALDASIAPYTDGTSLYAELSIFAHSHINKYELSTGAFVGWKGNIMFSPTAGDVGCNGMVNGVAGISGFGPFIYVSDVGNNRLLRLAK